MINEFIKKDGYPFICGAFENNNSRHLKYSKINFRL